MRVFAFALVLPLSLSLALADTPDEVQRRLKDSSPRVRQVAAEAAGSQKLEAAIPILGDLLNDKDDGVKTAAADALVKMGSRSVPVLSAVASKDMSEGRILAVDALGRIGVGAKDATASLLKALKEKNVELRIHAAVALGNIGPDAAAALPALLEAAKSDENIGAILRLQYPSGVADAAVRAALKIDPKCGPQLAQVALPILQKALKSPDAGTVMAAAMALEQLAENARPALPDLEEAGKTAKGFTKTQIQSAIRAIGGNSLKAELEILKNPRAPLEKRLEVVNALQWSSHTEEALPALIDLLEDREPRMRIAALQAIASTKGDLKPALPALLKLLSDVDPTWLVGLQDPIVLFSTTFSRIQEAAVPGLIAVLKDVKQKPISRILAASSLGRIGPKARAARSTLEVTMQDKFLGVAVESACADILIGGNGEKAMPVLRSILYAENPGLLQFTTDSLRRLGARAAGAVPELIALLDNRQPEVRISAAKTLAAIGPKARDAVKPLATKLKSENKRERREMAMAISSFGADAIDALPELIEALKTPDVKEFSIHPVLIAIRNLGPQAKDAVPLLVEQLKTAENLYLKDVMGTLARIGPDAAPAVPLLIPHLNDKDLYNRTFAARALGGIGLKAKSAIPALEKQLEDEWKSNRVWAAYALARTTGDSKKYVAMLVEFKKTDAIGEKFTRSVEYDVVEALALLGPEAHPALDLLLTIISSPASLPVTLSKAAEALGNLPDDAAVIVPRMMQLIERDIQGKSQHSACEDAIEVLNKLGPKAQDALPLLRKLAAGDNTEIREAAARAVTKISGKK